MTQEIERPFCNRRRTPRVISPSNLALINLWVSSRFSELADQLC
jgi:hypothetical protein